MSALTESFKKSLRELKYWMISYIVCLALIGAAALLLWFLGRL